MIEQNPTFLVSARVKNEILRCNKIKKNLLFIQRILIAMQRLLRADQILQRGSSKTSFENSHFDLEFFKTALIYEFPFSYLIGLSISIWRNSFF